MEWAGAAWRLVERPYLAGPALAVMGAGLWVEVASFRGDVEDRASGGHRPLRRRWIESGKPRLIAGVYLALMMLPTYYFYQDLWTQRAFELNSQSIQTADQALQTIGNLRRF